MSKSIQDLHDAHVVIIDDVDDLPENAGHGYAIDILLINKDIEEEIKKHNIWLPCCPWFIKTERYFTIIKRNKNGRKA